MKKIAFSNPNGIGSFVWELPQEVADALEREVIQQTAKDLSHNSPDDLLTFEIQGFLTSVCSVYIAKDEDFPFKHIVFVEKLRQVMRSLHNG